MSLTRLHTDESGHVASAVGALPAVAGAILLGIGAANDTGWLAITGGIVAGLGLIVYDLVRHTKNDYEVYERLDRLEGKK
jgi:uncharacterized membrane protein YebE (DUF533 family)